MIESTRTQPVEATIGRLALVTPIRRSTPCASGWALGIPVEIHLEASVGRAAVALHELHQLAEDCLARNQDDVLMAVATAADELAERLHDEPGVGDVSIAVGTALSNVGSATICSNRSCDSAVVLRRGNDRTAIGTAFEHQGGGGDVATATSSTAAASVRVARSVLLERPGRMASIRPRGSVLLIRADGSIELPSR